MVCQGFVAIVFVREAVLIYPILKATTTQAFCSLKNQQEQRARLRRMCKWLVFSAAFMIMYIGDTLALGFSGRLYQAKWWTGMWAIGHLARWGTSFGQIMLIQPRSRKATPDRKLNSTAQSNGSAVSSGEGEMHSSIAGNDNVFSRDIIDEESGVATQSQFSGEEIEVRTFAQRQISSDE